MARTLSANAAAGKGGSSNPVWLLEMDSSGGTHRFATETFIDAGPVTYYGNRLLRKSGLGKARQAIRIEEGGAFEETTELTIQLANADLYSDTIMSEHFENRRVEVRLTFADKPSAGWATGTCVFFGYVNDTPHFDFEKITFKCTRGQRKWQKKIPSRMLTKEEFEYLPEENAGKAIPIIYGDFEGADVHKTGIGYEHPHSMLKGLVVRRPINDAVDDVGAVVCANHDLKSFKVLLGGRLALHDEHAGFVLCDFSDGNSSFSDELYQRTGCHGMQVGASKEFRIVPEFLTQSGTANGANAVNEDASDYTTLIHYQRVTYKIRASFLRDLISGRMKEQHPLVSLHAAIKKTGITNDILRCTITKSDEFAPEDGVRVIDIAYGDMTDADVRFVDLAGIGSSGLPEGGSVLSNKGINDNSIEDDIHYNTGSDPWLPDQWNGFWVKVDTNRAPKKYVTKKITDTIVDTYSGKLIIDPETWGHEIKAGSRYEIYSEHDWDFSTEEYDEITIKFQYIPVSGDDEGTFSIKNLYLFGMGRSQTVPDVLYFSGKGRMFGAWIDNGAHSNSFREGDLIENPAYAIESLLIDELGATIANIAASQFDSVAANKASWKLARQILEQEDVIDFIREICYEFGFGCFVRPDGTFCVRRIDATSDSVATLDKSHMVRIGGDMPPKIERGSLKNMFNDFVLRYKVNMATGEPEKILFVRHPEAGDYETSFANFIDSGEAEDCWQACHDAYVYFQQINLWDYTAKWIHDDATAELFLTFMIRLLTRIPYKVTFTSSLDLIGLELLDEYKISHDLLPNAVSGVSRFRLVDQEIDPATDTIKNVFLEMV